MGLYNPNLHLFEQALNLRIVLLAVLILITIRYTRRGLQNGIILGLVTGTSIFELFKEEVGSLPIISLERVVWLIVLIIFLLKQRRGETERLPLDWIERSMCVFLMVIVMSLFSQGSIEMGQGGIGTLGIFSRGFAIPFLAYFIARRGVRTNEQMYAFFAGLGLVALYLVVTGLGESWGINWLVFPKFVLNPDMGIHYGKVRGIFLNASWNGLAIAMSLPVLIWLFFIEQGVRRWLWLLVAILAAVPLTFTMQRAAWLSAAAALGVTALSWPSRRTLLVGSLVFGVTGGFFVTSDMLVRRMEKKVQDQSTIDIRIALVKTGLNMFQDNPVTGVGFNRFGEEVNKHSPYYYTVGETYSHNGILTILAELGLVGFLPYMAIFGFLLFESFDVYRRHPNLQAFIGVLWGVTAAFAVMIMAVEMRGNLYPSTLLFALWGMGLAALRRHSAKVTYKARVEPAQLLSTQV